MTVSASDSCISKVKAMLTSIPLRIGLVGIALVLSSSFVFAAPTLGNYPNTMVVVGGNTTITPDAAPTGATSINVSTNSNFNGTFAASPTTGVVRVTNAYPAGTYTVTVKASGPSGTTTKTFTLTVTNGPACSGSVQFTNAADVRVVRNPTSEVVAIGDFNNDGKQDLAVASYDASQVTIYLGDGLGGFSAPSNVGVGLGPFSVAIGDFNNDGNQDFASANYGANTVSIRLGDGMGGFSGTTNVPVGNNPNNVAIGDFNNDGNLDFAATNQNSATVSIRLGNGSGGFTGTTEVPVGSNPFGVAIGDFNNDGILDFATAKVIGNTVSIRLGDGLGGFSGTTEINVGGGTGSIAIGDFNNDGNLDFAATKYNSNTVAIRLGDGLGGFSGTTEVNVGSAPVSVAIGDFNNDGNLDLATANQNAGSISVRLGNGSGGFSGGGNVIVGNAPDSVAIGDFNNDGKLDLAVGNLDGGPSDTVSIRLGGCVATPPHNTCSFSNGGLNPQALSESGVAAPAGFFWSEVQHNTGNTTEDNNIAGFAPRDGFFRLADDFAIGQPCILTSVMFYAYQIGAPVTPSPFTGYTLRIWNGRPGDAGASVIFGDTTTNRLASSVDSTFYRIFNSAVPPPGTATTTANKIWTNTVTINTTLPAGTYWFDWSSTVTGGGTHFQPSKTIPGSRGAFSDNARQLTVSTGLWQDVLDSGNPSSAPDYVQDFPFDVTGSVPVTIVSITRVGTDIALQCLGAPNTTYTVKFSPDLVTQFSFLASRTANAAGTFSFSDVNAASFGKRFYRVTLP